MKHAAVSLLGSRLCFDRSGRFVFAIEPDAIAVIALDAGKTHRIPLEHARVITCLADQLWVATRDDELVRTDFSGRRLAEPCGLPFAATAMFVPAPCGPPAAAWGSVPATMLVDDFGVLERFEVAEADATFPLTARRHLIARGSRLVLPSGSIVALPPSSQRSCAGGPNPSSRRRPKRCATKRSNS